MNYVRDCGVNHTWTVANNIQLLWGNLCTKPFMLRKKYIRHKRLMKWAKDRGYKKTYYQCLYGDMESVRIMESRGEISHEWRTVWIYHMHMIKYILMKEMIYYRHSFTIDLGFFCGNKRWNIAKYLFWIFPQMVDDTVLRASMENFQMFKRALQIFIRFHDINDGTFCVLRTACENGRLNIIRYMISCGYKITDSLDILKASAKYPRIIRFFRYHYNDTFKLDTYATSDIQAVSAYPESLHEIIRWHIQQDTSLAKIMRKEFNKKRKRPLE